MFKKKHIHFIGIGGIGMSGIAQVLYKKGFKVSGSDLSKNLIIKRLRKKMKIFSSHKADNINNADIVVYSSAIKKNNVELLTAQKLKIPIHFVKNSLVIFNGLQDFYNLNVPVRFKR